MTYANYLSMFASREEELLPPEIGIQSGGLLVKTYSAAISLGTSADELS